MTTDVAPVLLAVSWRSAVKATIFSVIMTLFGVLAVVVGSIIAKLIGVLLVGVGLVPLVDLLVCTRHWRLDDGVLHVPRLWAAERSITVSPTWRPSIDSVGRRDSIFPASTSSGTELVHPNLLVARSDVRQWLHLIGERQAGNRG